MRQILQYVTVLLIITGCNSAKNASKNLNTGNYDHTINTALRKLKSGKQKKSNQKYIPLLEEAFAKASTRDINTIKHLEADGNPENLERIYNTYLALKQRQDKIRPMLPLYNNETGMEAYFNFHNYSSEIIATKNDLSEHLYSNAIALLNGGDKYDARQAHSDLSYLDQIHPNFKDTRNLINQAHQKGTDFIIFSILNRTDKIIPARLNQDLLNMDTYGLNNDFWTVYHSNPLANIKYDYGIELELREIEISPEQINERHFIKEDKIVDGYEYLLDENEDQVRDSLGNKIKIDKYIDVRCELYEVTQFKSALVTGQVKYVNYQSKQLLKAFPLSSEFVFEHIYATFTGDRRALDQSSLDMIALKPVQFPSDEQMVYDAGTDLKAHLKQIIRNNNFK